MSEEPQSTPRWIISFADLLSVILCFFVLIYSMSIPAKKITEKYDNKSTNQLSMKTSAQNKDAMLTKTDINLSTSYLMDVLSEKANRDDTLKKLDIRKSGERIIISIDEDQFNPSLAPKLAALFKPISNDISLFTGRLDKSYDVANLLKENYIEKNIAIMESQKHKGKIDFVIYP